MERRQFTREFKLEAVRLIKERGVSYVFGAPCQLRWLAGQEHDRTIPLTDIRADILRSASVLHCQSVPLRLGYWPVSGPRGLV